MEINIYSQDGTLKLTASPGSGGQCVKQLQGDSELSLSFDYFSYVALDVNDYVDFCGDRYWLLEQYRPKEVSTIQWRYDVKLYGIESLIKRYLVIEHTDGDANPVFTLTAPASQHMRMIVECLNNATGTTDWQLGTVLTTGNITIDYTGKYCDEGLRELAEAANTEYWFSGDNGKTLNLCRCERGETIELKYGVGLISLERDVADNAKFYTRLYPVGSSRNINPETYGHTRLQLPNNQKYVDLDIAKYGVIDHYEKDAFSGIYPRYTGTVSTVRVEDRTDEDGTEFKVYFIKDASLPFNPNNFLLPNEKIRISFQTGDLQGLGETDDHYFEADYNSTTGEFEIINIWTDGEQLPRPGLEPETGNSYIPWNISMPQTYITRAEQELAAAVSSYNQAHFVDNSVYRGTTNHVWIEADQTRNIYIGRLVKLVSDQYFPSTGYRNSRIVKITRRLDLPSQMELEISDAVSTGTLTKINDSINSVRKYAEEHAGNPIKIVKTGDATTFTDDNVLSALRSKREFLSRLKADAAKGHITFERGVTAQGYIDSGDIEHPALEIEGYSTFNGNLSSPDFVSGFPVGTGWGLQKKEYTNAAGETEYKYVLECDGANIRGTFRVNEYIISQLLGENDNRIFTAMMEVHHYDPETGKVWMKTNDSKLHMQFRVNDCIVVQQYQPGNDIVSGGDGYVTKQYELVITEVGTGGATDENGERLDWVKFSNFTTTMDGGTAETLIAKNDTFCRLDNLTDPERKGIIQMMTVGTNMPYMDISYGRKTDPDGYLKGRLGNLQGINHHHFGWLNGFGIYTNNAYLVGDLLLRRSGESVDTSFEILRDRLAFKMAETVYEMTGEDNFLANPEFTELDQNGKYRDWTITANNNIRFYTLNGSAIISSVGTLANASSFARTELVEGKQVMHIVNASLSQLKSAIQQPQKHKEYDAGNGTEHIETYTQVWDTLYLSLRIRVLQDGTLTIGFPRSSMTEDDALKSKTVILESSTEWQTLKWDGVWDGNSDFKLEFTGECYFTLLSLSNKPLNDFKTEYSTQILQTTRNININASQISHNASSIASLNVEATRISGQVTQINSDIQGINGQISGHNTRIGALEVGYDTIHSSVNNLTDQVDGIDRRVSQVTQEASVIEQSVAALNTKKVALNDSSDWTQLSGNMIRYNNNIKVTKYTLFYLNSTFKSISGYYLQLYVDFYNSSDTLVASKNANGQGADTPLTMSVPTSAEYAKLRVYHPRRQPVPSDAPEFGLTYTEDNVITQSNLSLYVEDNISWLSGSANNIQFTFDKTFKIYSKDTNNTLHEVLSLTPSGDLIIAGKFHGEFDQTVAFGEGTKKMYIEPTSTGARIIGKDGNTQVLSLGFSKNADNNYVPSLFLITPNGNQDSLIRIQSGTDFAEVLAESAGTTGNYHFVRLISYPRYGFSTVESNKWPTSSSMSGLSTGSVYVDNNGFLKAKGY